YFRPLAQNHAPGGPCAYVGDGVTGPCRSRRLCRSQRATPEDSGRPQTRGDESPAGTNPGRTRTRMQPSKARHTGASCGTNKKRTTDSDGSESDSNAALP
ncbi:unnamed protein product, partial [Nesidiocoris tenuis]